MSIMDTTARLALLCPDDRNPIEGCSHLPAPGQNLKPLGHLKGEEAQGVCGHTCARTQH